MGFATLPMDRPQQYTGGNIIKRYDLYEKGNEGVVRKPGGIWLKVFHTDNMAIV